MRFFSLQGISVAPNSKSPSKRNEKEKGWSVQVLFIGSTRSYSIEKWVRKKKPIVPFNNTSSGTCRSERNKSRVGL